MTGATSIMSGANSIMTGSTRNNMTGATSIKVKATSIKIGEEVYFIGSLIPKNSVRVRPGVHIQLAVFIFEKFHDS